MAEDESEGYSAGEAQRRFEKLVRTALNTPPKPRGGKEKESSNRAGVRRMACRGEGGKPKRGADEG